MIFKVLTEEEDKFNKTIDQGLAILADMEENMTENGETSPLRRRTPSSSMIPTASRLISRRRSWRRRASPSTRRASRTAMNEQRSKARTARKTTNYMGADVTVYQSIDASVTTEFVGYDRLIHDSEITVLTTGRSWSRP